MKKVHGFSVFPSSSLVAMRHQKVVLTAAPPPGHLGLHASLPMVDPTPLAALFFQLVSSNEVGFGPTGLPWFTGV